MTSRLVAQQTIPRRNEVGVHTGVRLSGLENRVIRRALSSGFRSIPTERVPSRGPDRIRPAARALAGELALHLDEFWQDAGRAEEGPVDVIDMFSGCGGMSAGFLAANAVVPAYRLAAAVDVNTVANSTYEANLRLTPLAEDVAAIASKGSRLVGITSKRRAGTPLVLIGCSPCQGFSSHRNNTDRVDPRNSLFVDFARIASRLMPDAILVENVPELLTESHWPYIEKARSILRRCGYFVHLSVHNMAQFGLPQERFRALMIAMRHPFRPPQGFLAREGFRTVRHAIGHLPPVRAGERCSEDAMHYSAGHRQSTLEIIRAVPRDGGSRPEHVGPPCLRRAKDRNGRAVYEDVYGRLWWDRPAITITAYARNPASGRFSHPVQDRGLTVREAALLQGFPRGYWFAGTLDDRFRQIGNAVPPVFAAFLAAYILGEMLGPVPSPDEFSRGIAQPVGTSFSRLIPALKAGRRNGAA